MLEYARHCLTVSPILWCCHAPVAESPAGAESLAGSEQTAADHKATAVFPGHSDTGNATPAANSPNANPSVQPKPAKPADTRNPTSIQAAITENRPEVRSCYEEALKTNPGIAGDLVIKFVIRPDGAIKKTEVDWAESDIHIPELEKCALEVVSKIQFPASSRGMESKIHYPYNFHPGH